MAMFVSFAGLGSKLIQESLQIAVVKWAKAMFGWAESRKRGLFGTQRTKHRQLEPKKQSPFCKNLQVNWVPESTDPLQRERSQTA